MAYYYSNQSYAYQLGLYVHTVSQSVENNSSTIYWRLDLLKSSSAYAVAGGSAVFYVAINGVPQMNESIYFSMSSGQTAIGMRDGYVTIPHGSDGTAAFGVAFSFTPQTSAAYFPGSMAGNGVYTCAAIARATSPVLSDDSADLGDTVTITAAPATASFSHKLYYQIGNAEKVSIAELASGTTSYSWTVPDGIADSFTAATSGSITVICETYSGTNLIGTRSVNMTVTIPDSMVPAITSVTIAEAVAGLAAQFGCYVQHKSALSIRTAAEGVHGSTIDSIAVNVGGTAYSGAEVTTGPLTMAGSANITVTVTDSRGRTATSTTTITVVTYTAPTITTANAIRCDGNGDADEEGTNIKFTYKFNVASVSDHNTKSFKIQYRNGNTWTDLYTVSAYTGNSSYTTSGIVFDPEVAYDVRFVVSDYFTTTTIQKQVAPSFVLMDFGAGGKSMAIGMRSSNNGRFESALPSKLYKGAILGDNMRPTDMDITPESAKVGAVEHYLATGSNVQNKPSYDSHILHLHWDNTNAYDLQIAFPNNMSSEARSRVIQYRTLGTQNTWKAWRNMALNAYPVGAIYLSVVSTSPASLFGGTWEAIGQGRMLIGVGTGTDANGNSMTFANGATGGEYTSDQLNHGASAYGLGGGSAYGDRTIVSKTTSPDGSQEVNAGVNLMSPYLAVYMWKRTA